MPARSRGPPLSTPPVTEPMGTAPSSAAPSALGVLKALARAGLPVLLALFLARVAREKARLLQTAAPFGIDQAERPRDAVSHRVRLRAVTSARHGGSDVVLIENLDELERLPHDHARGLALEVRVARHAVDGDLTGAGLEPDAGHRSLSLTGRIGGFLSGCVHVGSGWLGRRGKRL